MSRRKSADRSGCSLVAEVVLIAGSHCLIELPLADPRDHEIIGVAAVCACWMHYAVGDPALGPRKA